MSNNQTQQEKEQETEQAAENVVEEQEIAAEAQAAEPQQDGANDDLLEKAKAEAEDYKRKWYAVTAEYENYRKRTQNAKGQAYLDGRADVVAKLFPIADNLDRALKSCVEEQTAKGISMVVKSFEKLLEDEKIVEINPVGEAFDPETSEAIMAVEGEGESGTVKEVYLKGYMREGKVLRFAQVVVIK